MELEPQFNTKIFIIEFLTFYFFASMAWQAVMATM